MRAFRIIAAALLVTCAAAPRRARPGEPPAPRPGGARPARRYRRSPEFRLVLGDVPPDAASVELQVYDRDSRAWRKCGEFEIDRAGGEGGVARGSAVFRAPREGEHLLRASARDRVGNVDSGRGPGDADLVAVYDRTPPAVTITSPAPGASLAPGKKMRLAWRTVEAHPLKLRGAPVPPAVAVELTTNGGRTWRRLADAAEDTGGAVVTVPPAPAAPAGRAGTGEVLLRIAVLDACGNVGRSAPRALGVRRPGPAEGRRPGRSPFDKAGTSALSPSKGRSRRSGRKSRGGEAAAGDAARAPRGARDAGTEPVEGARPRPRATEGPVAASGAPGPERAGPAEALVPGKAAPAPTPERPRVSGGGSSPEDDAGAARPAPAPLPETDLAATPDGAGASRAAPDEGTRRAAPPVAGEAAGDTPEAPDRPSSGVAAGPGEAEAKGGAEADTNGPEAKAGGEAPPPARAATGPDAPEAADAAEAGQAAPAPDEAAARAAASARRARDAYTRGASALDAGRVEEATRLFCGALEADRSLEAAWLGLSKALARSKRPGSPGLAEETLAEAAKLFPGNADFPFERGRVLADLGRAGEAKAELERACELRPGFAEAHWKLAELAVVAGDLQAARPHWREVVRSADEKDPLRARAEKYLEASGGTSPPPDLGR